MTEQEPERISAARERLHAEGRSWGRPCRLGLVERERIAELRTQGKSIRTIAQTVGVPRSTIARALAGVTAAGAAVPQS